LATHRQVGLIEVAIALRAIALPMGTILATGLVADVTDIAIPGRILWTIKLLWRVCTTEKTNVANSYLLRVVFDKMRNIVSLRLSCTGLCKR
jgi:hypothetical protein